MTDNAAASDGAKVRAPGDRRADALAIGVLAAYAMVVCVLAVRLPLAPDETYYWEWSRNPAAGYYDQGPVIAWWIRASCGLFGTTEWGIRAGVVLAALAYQCILWRIAVGLFGHRAAAAAAAISCVSPLAIAGGVVATYDPLLVLFWVVSCGLLLRVRHRRSALDWAFLGASVGLGFLSKHSMVLFVACGAIYLCGSPEGRGSLRGVGPWLAAVVAAAVVAPNLLWQSRHGWITFAHVVGLTAKGSAQEPLRRLGEFVGSQALVITPILFFAMVTAAVAVWRARRREPSDSLWFAWSLGAPVVLFFTILSLKTKVQANWAANAWPAMALLLAGWAHRDGPSSAKRRKWLWAGVAFGAVGTALAISPPARRIVGIRLPARHDQTSKMYGGRELAAAADRVRARMEMETGGSVVPGAATYDTTSRMAFYMAGRPRTRCFFIGTRLNSYVGWNDRAGLRNGGSALLADDFGPDDPRLPRFDLLFDRVVPEPDPVVVVRPDTPGESVREYHLYRCYGYRARSTVERAGFGSE